MNKLVLSAVAAFGLLAGAAPAKALTITATPSNVVASGTYNVTITQQADPRCFEVVVTGNNDGRTTATGTLAPAKHSVGRVSVGFLRENGTYIDVDEAASNNGFTTSGAGFVGSPWTISSGDAARYNSPGMSNDIAAFGGNEFRAIVCLGSGDQAAAVTIALQDGTQQWFAATDLQNTRGDLVPEPGSLALALPGLLPLALTLVRRRPRGDSGEAEDDVS